jgi:DNA-binding NarL/FixJ family response regulator
VRRAEAHLAQADGDPQAAVDLLTEAAGICRDNAAIVDLVRMLMATAEIERRRRRRGAARTLLREAASLCAETGASVWAARVDAELARLAPAPREGGVLTPMEERIAALVVQGATNREIAAALRIAVTTVESSLTQIYRRLGVRSRVELVRAIGESP